MRSKGRAIAAVALIVLAGLAVQAHAQPKMVGYNYMAVPAMSDVQFTVPFSQSPVADFTVDSNSGTTVTVAGSPMAGGEYNGGTYYVRFTGGNAEGLWATISNNGTSDFVLADAAVAAHVQAGDTFRVYEHHTLNSMFPKGMEGQSHVNGTQILIYENDLQAMAQNKVPSKTATWFTAPFNVWYSGGVVNYVLPPQTRIILRNPSNQTLKLLTVGDAPDFTVSVIVAPNGDLNIGTGYPVSMMLKDAGLDRSGRKVLFYNNNHESGMNKAPSSSTTYFAAPFNVWYPVGTGDTPIGPSAAMTLRLDNTEQAGTKVSITKPY